MTQVAVAATGWTAPPLLANVEFLRYIIEPTGGYDRKREVSPAFRPTSRAPRVSLRSRSASWIA